MDTQRLLRFVARYRKPLLAALFFVSALLLFQHEMQKRLELPARRYLSVKRKITSGTPVYLPDLAADLNEAPRASGQLTDQDLAWLQGASFRQSLEEGAAVTWDSLQLSAQWVGLSQRVPAGIRAMEIEAVGAAAVRPGDWVDLHLPGKGRQTLVAEAVRVLDVDARRGRVSIGVAPDLVEGVQASNTGPFRLVVRNPQESGGSKAKLRKTQRKKGGTAIPVYVD